MTDDHREEAEGVLRILVAEHRGAVEGLLVVLESDQMVREEVLADVFVLAWQRLDVLVGLREGQVRSWLLHSARFLCKNSARRAMSRRRLFEQLARDPLPFGASPEEVVTDWDLDAAVGAALEAVCGRDREVLVLHCLGMNGPRIAEELGMTHQAVRYRLSTARRTFRAAYVVPGPDGGPGSERAPS